MTEYIERFVETDVLPEAIDVTNGASNHLAYDLVVGDAVADQFLRMQKELRDMVEYIYGQLTLDRFSQDDDERARIKMAFLQHPDWSKLSKEMMFLFVDEQRITDEHLETIAGKRPFFNEMLLPVKSYQLSSDGTLTFYFEPSFSYLNDVKLWNGSSANSSVGGMVISPSDAGLMTTIAERGGNSHRDTVMLIPAGFIGLLDGDGHPIVKAFISELTDETGLTMADITELLLLGVTNNNAMGGPNVMPIFSAKTDKTTEERDDLAHNAEDSVEHQGYRHYLVQNLPAVVRQYPAYNPAYINQPQNKGTLLPQAANPLLVLAQRHGVFSHEVPEALVHMSQYLRSSIQLMQTGVHVQMSEVFPELKQS